MLSRHTAESTPHVPTFTVAVAVSAMTGIPDKMRRTAARRR